jgi:hypothetical protein
MQSATGSVTPPPSHSSPGLLVRAMRLLTGREADREASRIRWAEMRPIDFVGEDTSLTQAELELMR